MGGGSSVSRTASSPLGAGVLPRPRKQRLRLQTSWLATLRMKNRRPLPDKEAEREDEMPMKPTRSRNLSSSTPPPRAAEQPMAQSTAATETDLQAINRREAEGLCTWLVTSNGCMDARVLPDGTVAALQDLLFTRAIVLGCTRDGWAQRFCFEDRSLALQRYAELVGEDDVPEGSIATRQGVRSPARSFG